MHANADVGKKYRQVGRMRVQDRFLARTVFDTNDPNMVVLKLDLVMLGIRGNGILPDSHRRQKPSGQASDADHYFSEHD